LIQFIQETLSRFEIYVSKRPHIRGVPTITGSYPAYEDLQTIGERSDYYIHKGYKPRSEPRYYNDMPNAGWQDEVYRYGKELADLHGLKKVADIGCGSAFKLMKYFSDHETVGTDVPRTCEALRKRYPGRLWLDSDFTDGDAPTVDLAICSDVIEHVMDPDALVSFILRLTPKLVIISTPDRNLFRYGTHNGPPHNPTHIREWSMPELHAYLSEYLEIEAHFISNAAQTTQCVLGKPKSRP
jgi:ubiquinone/menaquinone biosynthesis C-methylase UbiE